MTSLVGFQETKGPSTGGILLLAGVVILLTIVLLYYEYKEHDCIRDKMCTHRRPEITEDDLISESIEKIQEMVRSNNSVIFWRQALLLAVLLPIPLIYLLYSRFPTFLEWGFVGLFIFLGVYLSYSWIWSHYFNPNSLTITNNLQRLSDRIKTRDIWKSNERMGGNERSERRGSKEEIPLEYPLDY